VKKSVASTILTCLGSVGVIATAVMAVKDTPKAELLLDKAEEEKGHEPLTKLEKVKAAAPAYIPTIITGVSTIACIFGANILNKRYQASLISAYALLDNSYKEYQNKVKELYGEDADTQLKKEIANEKYDKDGFEFEVLEGEQLFFDLTTMRYFSAPMDEVITKVTLEGGNECYIIGTPPPFME
jgi:hypothetical protein